MYSERRFRLRIIHKGLAVILIPVFLQVLCIGWLYVLVEKSERLAASETASSRVANLLTDITSELVVYTRNMTIKFNRGENRQAELQKSKEQILQNFKDLNGILLDGKDLALSQELREKMLTYLRSTKTSLD